MPHFWNNFIAVTKDELVPNWFNTESALKSTISRYANKPYGIKKIQKGGNGRQMLIDFDSLPVVIQDGLGDPRKLNHIMERFYKVDSNAVKFFKTFRFDDGTYLDLDFQERYIINASMIGAAIALKNARLLERRSKGGNKVGIDQSVLNDVVSFQEILEKKHNVKHTLPSGLKQFNKIVKDFGVDNYKTLISKKHRNRNPQKVDDLTIELLNNLFAGQNYKPTAAEVHRQYESFLSSYLQVINNKSGEVYNPKDFKKLSETTVANYILQWSNAIGTHAKRSGDRQKLMSNYRPYFSFNRPNFSNSIISIDDRQPPFKMLDGSRVWFYNGIDLASEAFTCWVYGKTKEGIILEFYRQMVRNYAMWNLSLPAELEGEMSLNSNYLNTFLQEGAMFQYIHIEANNARGKRIEAYYRQLRYNIEKERMGWLARPNALKESNQKGSINEKTLSYREIVQNGLQDIEKWNNMPHSVHKNKTRWDVFLETQNPNVQPTNYRAFLHHIGFKTSTSCHVGIVKLNNKEFLLGEEGEIALGKKLINLMDRVEGQRIDVYWLDDNEGNVLKAFIYINTQMICEAIDKPIFQKARIEQTDKDIIAKQKMASYVATIDAFACRKKHTIDKVTTIDSTPQKAKSFIMPGLNKLLKEDHSGIGKLIDTEDNLQTIETNYDFNRSLKDRF